MFSVSRALRLSAIALVSFATLSLAHAAEETKRTAKQPLKTIDGKKIDGIVIVKSAKVMFLLSNVQIMREYRIALGANPVGPKQQEGDERTPEGDYRIDYKNENSGYFLSLHITYPNKKDRVRAKNLGVDPGGDIMIHGFKNGHELIAPIYHYFLNWTDGCIGVSNKAMQEIWDTVPVGAWVKILP